MRWPSLLIAMVALALVIALWSNGATQAKTTFQINPAGGPEEATLQVSGDGFCTGEVRIELSPPEVVGGEEAGFFLEDVSQLHTLMPITVVESQGGSISAEITLPSREVRQQQFGSITDSVDILAIQPLHEGCSHTSGFFVAGMRYRFSNFYLTRAGSGGHADTFGSSEILAAIALLAGVGLVSLAAGFAVRGKG